VAASCQPTWTPDRRPGSCPKSSTDRPRAACLVRYRVAALVPRVEVFAEGTWPTIAFATRQPFARERCRLLAAAREDKSPESSFTRGSPAGSANSAIRYVCFRPSIQKARRNRRTYHGRYHIVAGRDENTAAAAMFVIEGGIRNLLHNRHGHAASSVVKSSVRPSLATSGRTFSAEWRPPT
jgi:hypothetical protein